MSPEKPDPKKKKATFDVQRGNAFMFPPEGLTIIEDEDHALFDERSKLPPSEKMIRSVMSKGVIEPVIIRKEGDKAVVVDGRQRVRAALEANKRLEKEGEDPISVPAIVRKGDDGDAMDVMVLLNEIRIDDDLVVKAKKAARLTQKGRTEKQIAELFGVSEATISNWLTLLELAVPVQAQVSDGRIRLIDAVRELSKLPKGEQMEAAAKLQESRPTRAANKADGKKANGSGPKVMSAGSKARKLVKFLAEDAAALNKASQVLVNWIAGEESNKNLLEAFPRLEPFIESLK